MSQYTLQCGTLLILIILNMWTILWLQLSSHHLRVSSPLLQAVSAPELGTNAGVDTAARTHLRHVHQTANSCVASPYMQISWTATSRCTWHQSYFQRSYQVVSVCQPVQQQQSPSWQQVPRNVLFSDPQDCSKMPWVRLPYLTFADEDEKGKTSPSCCQEKRTQRETWWDGEKKIDALQTPNPQHFSSLLVRASAPSSKYSFRDWKQNTAWSRRCCWVLQCSSSRARCK